jgi:hypothetical protein
MGGRKEEAFSSGKKEKGRLLIFPPVIRKLFVLTLGFKVRFSSFFFCKLFSYVGKLASDQPYHYREIGSVQSAFLR